MEGLAVGVERVPDRERHAEEALAAHEPVAVEAVHPVLVADPHVRRVPVQLVAPLEQGGPQVGVAAAVAEVPLAAGDDLERAVALLVELHRVGDLLRVADELARLAEQLDDALLGAGDLLAGELGLVEGGALGAHGLDVGGAEAAVGGDDRPGGQLQLTPPDHVGEVAEGADHGDAGALLRIGQRVRVHLDLDAEERGAHGGAEQRLVALVVGVGDEGDAGGQQLGAGGLDEDVAVGAVEGEAVVGAVALAVLELGLGDGRLEVDVPEHGRLGLVGLAPLEVAEERPLGDPAGAVVDGGVGALPVDRQPEGAEEVLEGLLVLGGERVAEVDEVAAADVGRHRLLLVLRPLRHRGGRRRSRGRRGAWGRTGPGSSSAPGARWAGRCRPSPSGRRPTCPASAGSGRWCRCGCS